MRADRSAARTAHPTDGVAGDAAGARAAPPPVRLLAHRLRALLEHNGRAGGAPRARARDAPALRRAGGARDDDGGARGGDDDDDAAREAALARA